jgi:hypothetical protein
VSTDRVAVRGEGERGGRRRGEKVRSRRAGPCGRARETTSGAGGDVGRRRARAMRVEGERVASWLEGDSKRRSGPTVRLL